MTKTNALLRTPRGYVPVRVVTVGLDLVYIDDGPPLTGVTPVRGPNGRRVRRDGLRVYQELKAPK